MASHFIALSTALAVIGQGACGAAAADTEHVACVGSKAISDTVGIVRDRRTGALEQSLVAARLAIVARGKVVGTLYVDDQGMRYVERRAGTRIPGLDFVRIDRKVYVLPTYQTFDGEARLRACLS